MTAPVIPTAATCTVGPDAVTGERCGAPAVVTFTGRGGETFAECAEHASSFHIHKTAIEPGARVAVRHCGIEKVGTVVAVTATRVRVAVPTPTGKRAEVVATFERTAVRVVA